MRPREVIRAFERMGLHYARQRGSHIMMTKPGRENSLSIPAHDLVAKGTLRSLIAKSGTSVEEFMKAAGC